MSEVSSKEESVWPETVRLRDCKIYDDLGGLGQRIYTTAGAGYEKREYVRADIVDQLRDALRMIADGTICQEAFPDSEGAELEAKTARLIAMAALEKNP